MIIETVQERLLVISDLHLGNPFSTASTTLLPFFDYARANRFNVCINGDGFEILQSSFLALATDSVEVMRRIRAHLEAGLQVFYVVGNHDIVLEKFISTFTNRRDEVHQHYAQMELTPFLNVTSGNARIRVEHGHLYDPSFVRHPALYEFLTRMAGPLLHIYPDVYRVWSWYEEVRQRLRVGRATNAAELSVYCEAADMLLKRGFDVVIFGHTHKPEDVSLGTNRRYVNSGNWVRGGSYVQVVDGDVQLCTWNGSPDPLALP